MVRTAKLNCDKCGLGVRKEKFLKRLNGGSYCTKCCIEKRAEHREFLKRDVLGIRKREDLKKEWAAKRKEKGIAKTNAPKIKGQKIQRRKTSSLGLFITLDEKKVLFLKYIKKGFDQKEAGNKVKLICKKMSELLEKLRKTKKNEAEINTAFKEKFARMVER